MKLGEAEDIWYVDQASELLIELSVKEKAAMERLRDGWGDMANENVSTSFK